jgi:hypothetical protein
MEYLKKRRLLLQWISHSVLITKDNSEIRSRRNQILLVESSCTCISLCSRRRSYLDLMIGSRVGKRHSLSQEIKRMFTKFSFAEIVLFIQLIDTSINNIIPLYVCSRTSYSSRVEFLLLSPCEERGQ